MRISGGDYRSGPVAWVLILASTCLVLFLFQKILWLVVPFLLALLIYYALLPIKLRLVLRGFSHDGAAALVSMGACGLLAVALVLATPRLMAEAVTWQDSALRYIDGGVKLLTGSLRQLEKSYAMLAQARVSEEFARQVADATDSFAQKHLTSLALGVAAWAPSLMLAPFLAFFMLRDGWRFKKFLGSAVPNAFFERTLCVLDQVDRTARLYFLGLMKLTLLDTLCLGLGLWLLGLPSALALALAVAILCWVPVVGPVMGSVLVFLVAGTDFPGNPAIAYGGVALVLVVRLLDDFVFMPMIVGKDLNMHPLLTVLMIFVGGAVAGVPGLMLVMPVLGVAMVLGETIGMVVTDSRLRARHAHARRLQQRAVTGDLSP